MTEEQLHNFDFASVDISEILPQRRPFVMVSGLKTFSMEETVTWFKVGGINTFMDGDLLEAEGLLENVAQSCALRIGFINKYILRSEIIQRFATSSLWRGACDEDLRD